MALKITDDTLLVYQTGNTWAYDFCADMEAARALCYRLNNETGKPHAIATFAEFVTISTQTTLARFPLCEITGEFFDVQLNQLPPMYRTGAMGFFCCEYTSGTVTTQFVQHAGRYYAAYVDMCDKVTWITPDKIAALPDAAPLSWFTE